jgi:hypothetical protein
VVTIEALAVWSCSILIRSMKVSFLNCLGEPRVCRSLKLLIHSRQTDLHLRHSAKPEGDERTADTETAATSENR